MIKNIEKIDGVECHEKFVTVSPAVKLRVTIFRPIEHCNDSPIVFVAGWVFAFAGWKSLISVMARKRVVYYIETREKQYALITNNLSDDDFCIYQNAKDAIQVCTHFGIVSKKLFWWEARLVLPQS